MEITQVKIFPVNEDKLKAFVSIVFDHCFMVNDIKVIQGKDGLFLSMPSRRKKNGEFKDVAHPLNNETRDLLERVVLGEYRQVVGDATPRRPTGEDEGQSPAPAEHRPDPPRPRATRPAKERAPQPAADEPPQGGEKQPANREKTLEEVEELHLRDSFWTVS